MEKRFPPGVRVWCSLRGSHGTVVKPEAYLKYRGGACMYGASGVYVLFENKTESIYTYAQACEILEVEPLRIFISSAMVSECVISAFSRDHQFSIGEKVRELSTHLPGTISRVSEHAHGDILVRFQMGLYKKYSYTGALTLLVKRESGHLQCLR